MSLIVFILIAVIPIGLLIGIPLAGPVARIYEQHRRDKEAGL